MKELEFLESRGFNIEFEFSGESVLYLMKEYAKEYSTEKVKKLKETKINIQKL